MTVSKKDITIKISGNYLSEFIPEDLFDDEDKLIEFIGENLWQPLENLDPIEVWQMIEGNAYTMCMYLKEQGIEIVD